MSKSERDREYDGVREKLWFHNAGDLQVMHDYVKGDLCLTFLSYHLKTMDVSYTKNSHNLVSSL